MAKIELIIQNGSTIYFPVVKDGMTWETSKDGVPGKLEFVIIKDQDINFQEGNSVRLKVDGEEVFYGFVFKKNRDKEHHIKTTCYDQLRYLKNKDTYVYENKTASEFIKMIAGDFNLNIGTIEDTGFKIQSRVEDNKTLFDMIYNALDITLTNRKKMYVLYDDFGKLTLKNIESMKLDFMIDDETGENFDYTSSIDGDTYNKIKLIYENKETGKREVYISQDSGNINKWGVLQYFDTIEEQTNGKVKADALLSLYNKKTRNLTFKNVFGNPKIRGGNAIIVKMNLGDIILQNYMIVKTIKHTFKDDEHFMDLKLIGGEFIA